MGDDDDTGGNSELFSSISPNGKGTKNKRKYLSEFLPDKIDMASLTEFPRYELMEEKLRNTSNEVGLLEGSDTPYQEQEVDEFDQDEWAHPLVPELQVLLSDNLHLIFKRAIQKMVENGHSKEVAEQTFLRCGFYHNTKDAISNAMDGALIFLERENQLETSRCHVFSDFDKLVNYTIVEMVGVLKEVRPGITVVDAMWVLLICDLNLLHACMVDRDHLGSFSLQEMFGEGSLDVVSAELKPDASETIHPSLNNLHFSRNLAFRGQSSQAEDPTIRPPTHLSNSKDTHVHEVAITGKECSVPAPEPVGKFGGTGREHVQNVIQGTEMEEKSGGSRKGSLGNSKRDMLRQKTLLEKNHKGRNRSGLKAKFTTWSGGSSGLVMKSTLSKITPSVGGNCRLPEGNYTVSNISKSVPQATDTHGMLASKDAVFALPAVNTKTPASLALESDPTLKTDCNISGSFEVPDYCAGIPYDESLRKYILQDDKEETILGLAANMRAMQREIQGWNEWANEKVMQATRRLSKDQMELKILRQEKEEAEKFKKEKQSSEENTLKRLSEMESALTNATNQMQTANLTIQRLENENSVLKIEVEAAKEKAFRATINLEETLLREQETLKRSQAMDKLKVSLQEELTTLKQHAANLRHQLERAEDRNSQLEALWKQEEREKQKFLVQAEDIRKETEQQKAKTKAEEDRMRETAESNAQKCNQHIKELENEISELRSVSESSKIAALLGGVSKSYGRSLTGSKTASACQEFQVPEDNKRLAVFQDKSGEGSVKPERECVMCLTEEMSVVFFPCAHQVLCGECNVLHEKQGMNDCPSCRTPIQERIYVRFADSQHSQHFSRRKRWQSGEL